MWSTRKLGEVCEIITGGTPKTSVKDFYGDDFLWAGPSDLDHGVFVIDTRKKLSEKGFRESGIRIIPKDSVMMSCIGYIGKLGIAKEEMATNQQINTFVPKHEILDTKYLYYALISKEKEFRAESSQTTLPIISKSKCAKIEIPVPPIGEQRKIVEKIEKQFAKIDEAARLRAESISAIDQLLPAALHEIFSEGKQKGCGEASLGDVCLVQSGGTPSKSIAKYWERGNIPWLRSEACKDQLVERAEKFITQEGLEHSSAKLLKPRTTLLALVGATIGRTGFLTFESTTNQNISGLFPRDENELLPEYLFVAVQYLYPRFQEIGVGKFKMANLTFVKSLKIPLPPLAEQKEIVKKLDALSEKARALRELQLAQQADLKALKQSFLHEASAG